MTIPRQCWRMAKFPLRFRSYCWRPNMVRIFLVASLLSAGAPVWSATFAPAFTITTCTDGFRFQTDSIGCELNQALAGVFISPASVEASTQADEFETGGEGANALLK